MPTANGGKAQGEGEGEIETNRESEGKTGKKDRHHQPTVRKKKQASKSDKERQRETDIQRVVRTTVRCEADEGNTVCGTMQEEHEKPDAIGKLANRSEKQSK